MDFQVFHQGEKGRDYKIFGNGFDKSFNVLFAHTKNGNEKANESSGTILVEFREQYKRHALEIMRETTYS